MRINTPKDAQMHAQAWGRESEGIGLIQRLPVVLAVLQQAIHTNIMMRINTADVDAARARAGDDHDIRFGLSYIPSEFMSDVSVGLVLSGCDYCFAFGVLDHCVTSLAVEDVISYACGDPQSWIIQVARRVADDLWPNMQDAIQWHTDKTPEKP